MFAAIPKQGLQPPASVNPAGLQLGDESPDVKISDLKAAFNTIQDLLSRGRLLAGHDISDGGIVVAALEMAFAGDW